MHIDNRHVAFFLIFIQCMDKAERPALKEKFTLNDRHAYLHDIQDNVLNNQSCFIKMIRIFT